MKNTLYMIGNTHFDPVWLWTWEEAMASIRSTFRAALDRMEEDPDFCYSFSTPAVFEWIEAVDPPLFARIKQRVAEGRWDVAAEGWWLQADCNTPTGESLVRQGLYGQRYLQAHFGKQATTMFNIDSFGHCAMLPQILKKAGMDYYVFARPNPGEKDLEDALFTWEAPDGSCVTAYRSGGQVGGEGYPADVAKCIREMEPYLREATHDAMLVYGVSNHGGAPTKAAIAAIREAMGRDSDHNIRFGSTTDFFAAQAGKALPLVKEELQPLCYGPFSDYSPVKKDNQHAEYALLNAEKVLVLGSLLPGQKNGQEKLARCWKDVLFNQFHDILGGTCIPQAYEDARNLHGRAMQTANEITHMGLQAICREIKTVGNNEDSVWNVVLFNLNATEFSGVVEAEVQWAWEFPWYEGGIALFDGEGNSYPAQVICERSVIPGFRTRFAFEAAVPAMGYKVFAVRKTEQPVSRDFIPAQIPSPFRPEVYRDDGDTWAFNTAAGYGPKLGDFVLESTRVAEQGEIFTTVKNVMRFRDSIYEEYITSYAHFPYIDYRYRVNWNEKHSVLKLMTEGEKADRVTAASPYGATSRAWDGKESPVNEWLTVAEGTTPYTLLLNGIFAYDAREQLRLTALRSPIYGDLRLPKGLDPTADYSFLGQGIHEGAVRFIPGALTAGEAAAQAAQFHNRVIVVDEANHPGTLPHTDSFLQISSSHTTVTVLKQAEEGDGIILRLAEYDGVGERVQINLKGFVTFAAHIKPYEIKTLKLSGGIWQETDLLECPI